MNGTILALDLGTTTGWATRSPEGIVSSGTATFNTSRYDGGGMRYLRFSRWLCEIADAAGPLTEIYFEEVRQHAGTDAAHVYGGFLATLTSWAEVREIPYGSAPVSTIKRHFTGKGGASKDAMIAAAKARGFNPSDDNEADALGLLCWATETNGGSK